MTKEEVLEEKSIFHLTPHSASANLSPMKTDSFPPAGVTPEASLVGFSQVSALAGGSFAVSGVEGNANASATDSHGKVRGLISDQARRDSRYQARPDCNQLTLVSGSNGPASLVRWADSYCSDTCQMSGVTAGETARNSSSALSRIGEVTSGRNVREGTARKSGDRNCANVNTTARRDVTAGETAAILSAWRNAKTQTKADCIAARCRRQIKLSSQIAGSNPAALTTCHPKRSWLCRLAAGFIHALGGRDIASRTRLVKPIATGNSRPASGHAPSLRFILLAFASVALGDPGHGADLNRMNHANALFSALSQVESGDRDHAVGLKGEVTRFQILPAVWKRFGGVANPVEPVSALRVAELVMRPRVNSFIKTQGRPPSAQEWYLLWHCPARVMKPRKSDTQKAERFANLVK